jgi:hypothetical protein
MAETADDILAHFGVVGMKWGKHKSSTVGETKTSGVAAPSREEIKAKNKASKAADVAKRNTEIDAARERYNGSARKNYLDAKAQYKVDKVLIGKREAAKAFNKVKDQNASDYAVAQLAKSGKETTRAILLTAGAIVLGGAVQALAHQ